MRQVLPVPQRVMAVVLSVLFVFCPFAAYAAGETDAAADPVLLPIIMYHEVKPDKPGKDAIQPWEFEADLKWLADNGYTTIVMADLIAYVRDGTPLPEWTRYAPFGGDAMRLGQRTRMIRDWSTNVERNALLQWGGAAAD